MGRISNPGIGKGGSFYCEPPLGSRQIPGFSRYYAKKDGSVWTTWRMTQPRKMKAYTRTCRGSYKVLLLTNDDDERKMCLVHRLILLTFVGPPASGQQCRHLNGVKSDNRLKNLKWGTSAENTQDAIRLGELKTKLTEHDACKALQLFVILRNAKEVAQKLSLPYPAVRVLIAGETWKHLPRPLQDEHGIRTHRGGRAVQCECGHKFYTKLTRIQCSHCKQTGKVEFL